MPSTSSRAAEARANRRRARIIRLDRLADSLDSKFRVFGVPVGWDSIFGLIPGVGDVVTALPGVIMVYEASQIGARKRAVAQIAVNTGIDTVIGGIPVLGDAFDVVFKSHRRNVDVLKRELARIEAEEARGAERQSAQSRRIS